jgi:putative SOS response-associated peptidase YedK
MCGRYVTITKVKEIEKRFGVTAEGINIESSANVSAGQLALVITN